MLKESGKPTFECYKWEYGQHLYYLIFMLCVCVCNVYNDGHFPVDAVKRVGELHCGYLCLWLYGD